MQTKNGIATFGIAGRLMHALQRSNSPKLQKIWKEKISQKKQPTVKREDQN